MVFSWEFFLSYGGALLKGNGEIIVVLVAAEVVLQPNVDVLVQGGVFSFQLFRQKFERLSHAIFGHFLLRLLEFLELAQQNFVYFPQFLIFGRNTPLPLLT